jgi:hypothetical protein
MSLINYKTRKGKELLSKKIDAYFDMCDALNKATAGDKREAKPYTLSGLLYYLDLSAEQMKELCEKRAYARLIGSAKRRIEAYIEENALSGRLASTAAINSLKEHFGWFDGADDGSTAPIEIYLDKDCDRLGL